MGGESARADAVGGVGGDTARRATARGFGLSFGFPATCLGASTTMLGSGGASFPPGGVCDSAGPLRLQSRSEAVPEAANIGLTNTDILQIPIRTRPARRWRRNWKGLPSCQTERFRWIAWDRPCVTRRSPRIFN